MKKTLLVVVVAALLLLVGATTASAQFRLEGDIFWPAIVGIKMQDTPWDAASTEIGSYAIIVPDVQVYYQFGGDFLRGGIGARIFTVLVQSLGYPAAFLELNLKPIVLNLSLGGWAFGTFGIAGTHFDTMNLSVFDLNVGWALAPWFRLGAGVIGVAPWEYLKDGNFAYLVYVGAKFVGIF